jgi:glycosidase
MTSGGKIWTDAYLITDADGRRVTGGTAGNTPSRYPSPADWRNEILYSILIDRFDWAGTRHCEGDPADGNSRHGGNLAGVAKRLGYLQNLGVTAIVLSPVAETASGAYHGYAPIKLDAVDPRLGSMADLVALTEAAHRRGIRVVLDLVLNHVGPVFDYADGDGWKGVDNPGRIARWRSTVEPPALASPVHFSRRGIIEDWKDPDQASWGDFPPNLRRLATENPATQPLLIDLACRWISMTGIDGIRLDAIRHMSPDFVRRLVTRLRKRAAALGKNNFLVVGEYSSTADRPIAECMRLGIDSAFNYPEYRRQSWALHGKAPCTDLTKSFETARAAFGRSLSRMVRFIDNHDVYRFLRDGEPESLLRPALAFLVFSAGIPLLYYGTEQAFRQPTDRLERECSADRASPRNREDMFGAGMFTSASSSGDKFDENSATYRWTRQLLAVRAQFAALRTGEQIVRHASMTGPGIFAFSRVGTDSEVVVVLNTADVEQHADVTIGARLGADRDPLRDALDPQYVAPVRPARQRGAGVRARPKPASSVRRRLR